MRRVLLAVFLGAGCWSAAAHGQQSNLGELRESVRTSPAPAPEPTHHDHDHHDGHDDNDKFSWLSWLTSGNESSTSGDSATGTLLAVGALGAACVLASPYWGPNYLLEDSFSTPSYFQSYPYATGPGRIVIGDAPAGKPTWSGRFSAEYADEFDHVQRLRGHLLLENTSRFGLDTEADWLSERNWTGGHDQLWIGDCNAVFRFAQSEHMQFRSGIGINWLNDVRDTNLGFNFTYGADWFPCRPWVFTSEIDWGTLGTTDLFRFRVTAGAVLWRTEAYTGFEYLDVGRTQLHGLVAGLRLWF